MKFYAIKNVGGKWLTFGEDAKIRWDIDCWAFNDHQMADYYAEENGGHVVELVEAPAKVVLTEEQAEIVENARDSEYPAAYISVHTDEEDLLMKACVNGYTVAKEKKYNVKVPLVQAQGGLWFYINSEDKLGATYLPKMAKKFTMDEIEENGLQDCEKTEVEQDAE